MRRSSLAAMLLAVAPASHALAQYTVTTLASFDGTTGSEPLSGLSLSDGNLYGTTYLGGTGNPSGNGWGVVYSVPIGGGGPNVLTNFNGTNGKEPYGGVTIAGNTLYGTTTSSTAGAGPGEVYSLPISGGTPTILATFNGQLQGGLLLSGNTLYGTNAAGLGEVFSEPISGGTPTVLATFNGTNGFDPWGPLVMDSNGNLYGTTEFGGPDYNGGTGARGYGTVFEVAAGSNTVTTLTSFDGTDEAYPYCSLLLSNNTLYGTTAGNTTNNPIGRVNDGDVFSLSITGGNPTILASFDGNNGELPYAGVIVSGNTLFGTTYEGGPDSHGVVYSVPITGGSPTVLAPFGSNQGDLAYGDLLMDASGNIYGTTEIGGAGGAGTVFELVSNVVPEPTSISILALCSLTLVRRRREEVVAAVH